MTNVLRIRAFSVLMVFVGALPFAPVNRANAGTMEIPWSVEIYSDNSDYIVVRLDARAVPRNTYLESVWISVTFFGEPDQQTNLGKKNFRFMKEQLDHFKAGEINVAYFQHSFESAQSVRGERLEGYDRAAGGKADTAPTIVGKQSGNVEGNQDDGRSLGEKPPKK
jgi:hypothetical protein